MTKVRRSRRRHHKKASRALAIEGPGYEDDLEDDILAWGLTYYVIETEL
jgi:hypothetical protein